MYQGDYNPLKGPHPYGRDHSYGTDTPKKAEENKPDKKLPLFPIAIAVILILILFLGLAANR